MRRIVSKNLIQAIANIISIIVVEEILRGRVSELMVLSAFIAIALFVNLPFKDDFWRRTPTREVLPGKRWVCMIASILSFIVPLTILYDRFDYLRTLVVCYVSFWIISVPCEYWISHSKNQSGG
jgi:hypothetical protein